MSKPTFVIKELPPIQEGKKSRVVKFRSHGKFYSTQNLLDMVHELSGRGFNLAEIAAACGINYRTVVKALKLRPNPLKLQWSPPHHGDRFVIVTETGLIGMDALSLMPQMNQPWIHGAAIEDSTPVSIRRRLVEMGDSYGWIRVARLVYVDPATLREPPPVLDPREVVYE
jgi:hypothetical protein